MINNFLKLHKIQFVKFGIIGVISTFIHSLIYLLFLYIIPLPPQAANALGFLTAMCFSYLGQRFWTFREAKVKNEKIAGFKFFFSAGISYLLNSFWVFLVEKILKISPSYALIGIIGITPALTFLLLKYWAFKSEI